MSLSKYDTTNVLGILILATFVVFLVNVLVQNVNFWTTLIVGSAIFILGLSTFLTFSDHRRTRHYSSYFFLLAGIYAIYQLLQHKTSVFSITLIALVALGFLSLLMDKPKKRKTTISVTRKKTTSSRKKTTKAKKTKPRRKTKRKK